jgi:hypothetical protein
MGTWHCVSLKLIHIECEWVLSRVAFSCISIDSRWRVLISMLSDIRPKPSWCQMNPFLVCKSLLRLFIMVFSITIYVRLNASPDSCISHLIILIVLMGEHEGGSSWVMEACTNQTCGILCPWALHEGFSGHPNGGIL